MTIAYREALTTKVPDRKVEMIPSFYGRHYDLVDRHVIYVTMMTSDIFNMPYQFSQTYTRFLLE